MKRKAITRIIIHSIVLVLLFCILAAGITADLIPTIRFDGFTPITGGTQESSGTVSGKEVKELDIHWSAGSITILSGDDDQIRFSESGSIDEDEQMVWKLSDNKLIIQYNNSKVFLGLEKDLKKDLLIVVPDSWFCNKLTINSAAANVVCKNLSSGTVELNSASGESDFNNCEIDELEISTASGDVTYFGKLSSLECSAVSADVEAKFTNVPDELTFDGVSGNLDLTLPYNAGFRAELDTISGHFETQFQTTVQGDAHITGDGKCEIEISGISGNISIDKYDTNLCEHIWEKGLSYVDGNMDIVEYICTNCGKTKSNSISE